MENQPLLSGELPRLKKRGFAVLVFIAVLTTIAVIISGLNTRQVTVNQVSGVRWFCA
jgi:type II secretory pathway component PulK